MIQILVRFNNIEQGMKALKKKMQREGIFKVLKIKRHHEKPSERKVREQAESLRRIHKLNRKNK